MKPLKDVVKNTTKVKLLEVIRAALDCPSHFHKPRIIERDKDFKIGESTIVICGQCVDRMREALGLEKDDPAPCNFAHFYGGKAKVTRKK